MDTQNNLCSQEINNLEHIKHLQRVRERNERKERQKEDNHWIFLAGTLVAQYLKADLNIPVFKGKGAAEKNAASFEPLENILAYLAAHKEFTTWIMEQHNRPPPDTT